ncbi:MAG TPA: dNTP triphosphohydrolase [Steroidobacteraceae bacterium]|nr:dNTP triphosphohydrolase [Steroidobacteraceae bacterium]
MDWTKLLNEARRKSNKKTSDEFRTEHERDYDRILFCTPVRRLGDKTQVFPLERNDSVRNRLTHSHEVSNLCRSMGTWLAFTDPKFKKRPDLVRSIPSILAAAGLAHDLGNPPFGHKGEYAIQAWFKRNRGKVLDGARHRLAPAQKADFLLFEGNAQTFRILTRLQLLNDDFGLDLTYATLAAVMKYPTASNRLNDELVSRKKHGFFQSEVAIARQVWKETGLRSGLRHPLTYLMEACDDIAYTVMDAEDAVKKGLVSFSDLMAFLGQHCSADDLTMRVVHLSRQKHDEYRETSLSPGELNDISMQRFRVYAIGEMVAAATRAFGRRRAAIEGGRLETDLLAASEAAKFRKCLKDFDFKHAYRHKTVLAIEATGTKTIWELMDILWAAITDRKDTRKLGSQRSTPFLAYAYERISENYRRIFESDKNRMPVRYKEAQLLTDMISGMTDTFAVDLLTDLKKHADRDYTKS